MADEDVKKDGGETPAEAPAMPTVENPDEGEGKGEEASEEGGGPAPAAPVA